MEVYLKRSRCEIPILERSPATCDLRLVCSDGVLLAHQWMLANHSPSLTAMFRSLCSVQDVKLTTSIIPGLPAGLIIERSHPELVTLMVPEYSQKTVTVLLDLLYQGKSRDCGDLDRHGKRAIVALYRDFGLTPERGGLPIIQELNQIEIQRTEKIYTTFGGNDYVVTDVFVIPELNGIENIHKENSETDNTNHYDIRLTEYDANESNAVEENNCGESKEKNNESLSEYNTSEILNRENVVEEKCKKVHRNRKRTLLGEKYNIDHDEKLKKINRGKFRKLSVPWNEDKLETMDKPCRDCRVMINKLTQKVERSKQKPEEFSEIITKGVELEYMTKKGKYEDEKVTNVVSKEKLDKERTEELQNGVLEAGKL